jgi:hypothetical protein
MPRPLSAVARMRRPLSAVALLTTCGLMATACAGGNGSKTTASSNAVRSSTASTHSPVAPNGQPIGHLSTPGTPKGEQSVSIAVVATPGQSKRQTLALVPVTIHGQGPFPFALDTGASRSLIALALAQKLRLPDRGSAGTLVGVGGASSAQNVAIAGWRAGNVSLPNEVIAAISSKAQTAHPGQRSSPPRAVSGPVGLLGSDVLSRYGKIAIDYDKGLLILDPPIR